MTDTIPHPGYFLHSYTEEPGRDIDHEPVHLANDEELAAYLKSKGADPEILARGASYARVGDTTYTWRLKPNDAAQLAEYDRLEAAWIKALARSEAEDATDSDHDAEEKVFEEYAELGDELGICNRPRCRELTTSNVDCPKHMQP